MTNGLQGIPNVSKFIFQYRTLNCARQTWRLGGSRSQNGYVHILRISSPNFMNYVFNCNLQTLFFTAEEGHILPGSNLEIQIDWHTTAVSGLIVTSEVQRGTSMSMIV